ncbi:hypothetical protein [Oribacterium sp. P6A1]|uniref:hypothetical protein n=1 Tax=Oribacterium sp. P6A1 TaxID=1410612 RepID=UPI00055C314F|nr:hypothetical protein [Oribacterium sp. P6A1]
MKNKDHGLLLFITSAACMSRSMSRLIMKYGPGLLEKMDQERLRSLISAEIESGADKDRFSARMLGYCKLMTDGK